MKLLPSWNTDSTKSMKDLYVFTPVRFLLLFSSLNSGIRHSTSSSCVQSRIVDGQRTFSNSRMFDFRTSNLLKQVNLFLISCREAIAGYFVFDKNQSKRIIMYWNVSCVFLHKSNIYQAIHSQIEGVCKP